MLLSVHVCVSTKPRLHAALVSAAKVMCAVSSALWFIISEYVINFFDAVKGYMIRFLASCTVLCSFILYPYVK